MSNIYKKKKDKKTGLMERGSELFFIYRGVTERCVNKYGSR